MLSQLAGVSIAQFLLEILNLISSSREVIEAAALQLTPSDRARLAERLLASLDEDDQILAAWVAVAERRGEAFARGEMDAIDFDEAVAQARIRITNCRPA